MLTRKQRFVIEWALLGGTLGLLIFAFLSCAPDVISRAMVLAVIATAAGRVLLALADKYDRHHSAAAERRMEIPPLDSTRAVRAHVTLVVVIWVLSVWAIAESVPDLAALLIGLTLGVITRQLTLIANGTKASSG